MWKVSIVLIVAFVFMLAWISSERFKEVTRSVIRKLRPKGKSQLEKYQDDVIKAKTYYDSIGLRPSLEEVQQLVKDMKELQIKKNEYNNEIVKSLFGYFVFFLKVAVAIVVFVIILKSEHGRERAQEILEQLLLVLLKK